MRTNNSLPPSTPFDFKTCFMEHFQFARPKQQIYNRHYAAIMNHLIRLIDTVLYFDPTPTSPRSNSKYLVACRRSLKGIRSHNVVKIEMSGGGSPHASTYRDYALETTSAIVRVFWEGALFKPHCGRFHLTLSPSHHHISIDTTHTHNGRHTASR